jgi:hypothetical protein
MVLELEGGAGDELFCGSGCGCARASRVVRFFPVFYGGEVTIVLTVESDLGRASSPARSLGRRRSA